MAEKLHVRERERERERQGEREREEARKVILPKMRLPGHAQFAPKRRDLT